ncbi:MAG: hypothetical protein FWG55_07365 [Candidatus Bathyarchaeota archaeon]|nr:hypothetical protein [Candidatus Termiticorpusculum sp.]
MAFSSVSAAVLVEDFWNTKNSMSQARGGLGVVAVDGKIYAIGGVAADSLVGTNECYDPLSDTWVTLEPMPIPRAYFAIAAYQSKIYCIGGIATSKVKGEWDACAVNEVYDTLTDSWNTKMSYPSKDGRWLDAQVIDEQIFVRRLTELFTYDPVKDTWTTKTSMPIHPASEPVCAVVDDKIMVTCRYLAGDPVVAQAVMIYDTKADVWSERKAGPTLMDNGIAAGVTTGVYVSQKIYVFFGTLDTLVYDYVNDSWSSAKAMPTDRRNFGVAVVDDVLYVIGGFSPTVVPLAVNEQYVPIGYRNPVVSIVSPLNQTYGQFSVSLNFTLDRSVVKMCYVLDGQDCVVVDGNVTLSGLSVGAHDVTVYVKDTSGNVGTSENIIFTITPKPLLTIPNIAILAIVISIVAIALVFYFKNRLRGR